MFSLWINGVQETTTQSFSGNITNNTDTYIGAVIDYQGGISTLRRRVDSVLAHTRALSANEIQRLYLVGRGGMFERRRRTLRRVAIEQAGFKAYWAQRSALIGSGVY